MFKINKQDLEGVALRNFVRNNYREIENFFLAFGPPATFEYAKGSNIAYFNGDVDENLAEDCAKMLVDMEAHDEIIINLHSFGGIASEGVAVCNLLANSGKHVTINVTGIAYSAASIILQGADNRRVAPGSIVGIHNTRAGMRGTAEDMEWMAEALKVNDKAVREIYSLRANEEQMKRIDQLMNKDTGLTGQETVDLGLADAVISKEERDQIKSDYQKLTKSKKKEDKAENSAKPHEDGGPEEALDPGAQPTVGQSIAEIEARLYEMANL